MRNTCLALARTCLAAYLGMAAFFLVAIVALRLAPVFSDEQKLEHPRILFPLYYAFEFTLLGGALVAQGAARAARPAEAAVSRRPAEALELLLVSAALVVALGEFFGVYRPLAAMIERSALPTEFAAYHRASRWANAAVFALSGLAALLPIVRRRPD